MRTKRAGGGFLYPVLLTRRAFMRIINAEFVGTKATDDEVNRRAEALFATRYLTPAERARYEMLEDVPCYVMLRDSKGWIIWANREVREEMAPKEES